MAARAERQPPQHARARSRAAAVSIVSNTPLIVLKLVAGVAHRLGRDPHRGDPLGDRPARLASSPTSPSARPRSRPTPTTATATRSSRTSPPPSRAMLILVGSGVIVYAAIRRLDRRARSSSTLGVGIVVVGFATVVNLVVSTLAVPPRARDASSAALEGDAAHLRTDAYTSVGVLVGLALVQSHRRRVARPGRRARDRRRDRRHRPADRRWARWRVLVDEALPDDELDGDPRRRSRRFAGRGVVGYHQLRTRRAGARRYVDLHVQFRSRHHARGRARDRPRAAGRDRGPAAGRRRRADPPRAGGPGAAGRSGDLTATSTAHWARSRPRGSMSPVGPGRKVTIGRRAAETLAPHPAEVRPSAQVDRRRERDGEHHAGVAVVAGEQQDQGRDQADGRR